MIHRLRSPEVLSFLLVGGIGYVVDVLAFNRLLSTRPFSGWDPSAARVVAVAVATVVTYAGNRMLTWRGSSRHGRRREVLTLVVSHHLLGLTSRLADNVSANLVGLALGTAFRFWSYRSFVFGGASTAAPPDDPGPGRVEDLQSVA